MYVTDISRWEAVGRAHGQIFRDIRPAATMVEVSRLVDPDMLVEVEVDAVVGESTTRSCRRGELRETMGRITERFARRKAEGQAAFVPFLTAGDPSLDRTVEIALGLEAAGADVLELGVPFSDPIADGPVIQRSSERALARGVTLAAVLGAVRRIREAERAAAAPLQLLQPAAPVRPRPPRRGSGRGRRRRRAGHRPPARGGGRVDCRRARRRRSTPSSWPPPPALRSGCDGWPRPAGASSTR